ncbi:putative reverse transcriptase domain-containing protein [Tanacetum coccineum]
MKETRAANASESETKPKMAVIGDSEMEMVGMKWGMKPAEYEEFQLSIFQELTMKCTKMVPKEEDRVEKFIGGLPNNIQGNVIAAEPTRLQDAVQIANNLMDKKLKGYAVKNAENKRRLSNNYRNILRGQMVNQRDVTCFEYGAPGHFWKDCPKVKNQNRRNKTRVPDARGKAYVLGGGDVNPGSNTVTELGSFDVIIGMNWLAKNHAVIVCDKKIVRIPYGNEILIVQRDKTDKEKKSILSIISCVKETEDKSKEKRLEDVPTVRDFLEVFLEDLPGLPPTRQVEFQFDLVPGAAPVARAHIDWRLDSLIRHYGVQVLPFGLPFAAAMFHGPDETEYADLLVTNFLDTVIDSEGFHVDHAKIEVTIKDWEFTQDPEHEKLRLYIVMLLIKGLRAVLMQKTEKVIAYASQLKIHKENYKTHDFGIGKEVGIGDTRWYRSCLSDYDCELCYHSGKANVVADTLSQKSRPKPLRVRALVMTIGLNLLARILTAQVEAREEENY